MQRADPYNRCIDFSTRAGSPKGTQPCPRLCRSESEEWEKGWEGMGEAVPRVRQQSACYAAGRDFFFSWVLL